MNDVDGKYQGYLYKQATGAKIDDDWVVFRAKDNAFAAILPSYIAKCIELGCDVEHIASIGAMASRVYEWRATHPELCKNPDL